MPHPIAPPKSTGRLASRCLAVFALAVPGLAHCAQPGTGAASGPQPSALSQPAAASKSAGFAQPTPCPLLDETQREADEDIHRPADATLTVMFHGNRFVAAKDLVTAFELLHPEQRLAWTAIPPINTVRALQSGGRDAGMAGQDFMPDVVLGPTAFGTYPLGFPQTSHQTNSWPGLDNLGLYSRIHGLVLMARADDARVQGQDWAAIVHEPSLRIVLPGSQPRNHALVQVYEGAFGAAGLDALPQSTRVGVSMLRHHRSIPARILAGCEDVGIQFGQSKAYWAGREPGRFKFVDVALSASELSVEDSFVYVVQSTKHPKAARAFADFMHSDVALAILREYDIAP